MDPLASVFSFLPAVMNTESLGKLLSLLYAKPLLPHSVQYDNYQDPSGKRYASLKLNSVLES